MLQGPLPELGRATPERHSGARCDPHGRHGDHRRPGPGPGLTHGGGSLVAWRADPPSTTDDVQGDAWDDEEHPDPHLVEENPTELEGVELLRRQPPPAGQAMHQITREEVQQAPQGEEDVVDDGAPEEHAAHLLDVHVRSPRDVEGSTRPARLKARGRGSNVRRVFIEPRTFDLVLWVQGSAAAPNLEAGEIS